MPDSEGLLTAQEVAARLKVSPGHVYNLGQQQKLPRVMVGNAVRFDPADVDRFIADNRETSRERQAARPKSAKPGRNTRLRPVK